MHENTLKIQMLNNFICGNKLNNYERCLSVFGLVDLQIEKKVKTIARFRLDCELSSVSRLMWI